MRTPASLQSLVDEGIVDEVVRPLMSGKEAQVYLVRCGTALRVAKIYKDAQHRSFKQRAEYTEGRNVRNSRDQRAMSKRTNHGKQQDEAAWRSAEVDMIYRLRAAGVRVPAPYNFVDGVLIMELVTDESGLPAPRLGDMKLDPEAATKIFDRLIAEVIRMLSAGVVHGDLSDFNVLMGPDGPVIIDFPQAVDASGNQNARKLLLRDVDNLHNFISRFFPGRPPPPFAQEMWQVYERGELTPDYKLKGTYRAPQSKAGTGDVLSLIADADHDERRRRESRGVVTKRGGPTSAQAQPAQRPQPPRTQNMQRPPQQNMQRPPQQNMQRPAQQNMQRPPQQNMQRPPQQNTQQSTQATGDAPPRRRSRGRRRRGGRGGGGGGQANAQNQ